MIPTKTQCRIMQLFVSQITARFSIREVGRLLRMHQALAYRSCRALLQDRLIVRDDDKYVLNYKENHQELAFFEHLRSKECLDKPANKVLAMFTEDMISKFPYGHFVLLVFGSAVAGQKPRDIDVMVIIEKTADIDAAERALHNIARNYALNLHTLVLSFESVFEMLGSRDEKNVINQVLNKHLIIYGAELFYRLLKQGRR